MLDEFKSKSKSIIEKLKEEMAGIRASRPTPALVENIKVSCYGQSMPLKQVGSINIVPPREIAIHIWDKGVTNEVVRAIETSDLGVSVNAEGNVIRLHLPELSGERREEIAKHIKKETERYRIQIRCLRDEIMKKINVACDSGEIGKDEKFRNKEEIQKETESVNKETDAILERKIAEINE